MRKTIIVVGATGQDASYLADFHLALGDRVIGVKRRSSTNNEQRLASAKKSSMFSLVEGDMTDPVAMSGIVSEYQPDVVYGVAAQSHVGTSFTNPGSTIQTNVIGILNCLEAIKNNAPQARFIHTGTSEQFGSNYDIVNGEKVQNENTVFYPQSPYAVAKVAAYDLVRLYRNAYGMFASNAISFNHGGPRRGENFIEMKVGKWIREHKDYFNKDNTFSKLKWRSGNNEFEKLHLGNLDSWRDFTDARDIVAGLIKIGRHEYPDDFVLCSEKSIQMRDLVENMFAIVEVKNWEDYVYINPELFRPAEVDYLRGDSTKAREVLNWEPTISLDKMCRDIIYES